MTDQLDLKPLMEPASIGVLGASVRPGSRGARILANLEAAGYRGEVYPINPRYETIGDLRCYPSVADIPTKLDTLVVAIPAADIPNQLDAAQQAGTRAAVVLASGFREAGAEGKKRHDALVEIASRGMAICGPNCYGVLNVSTGSAAFSGRLPNPMRSGPIAVISQSGGFSNLIANPLVDDRGLGVKYIVSCGNSIGGSIEDYLSYLIADPEVHTVAAFVEALTSPERLLALGRQARESRTSVVILKSGKSEAGRAGVASHTGAVAGSAEVASAVLSKAGFIEVNSLDEMVETTALLAHSYGDHFTNRIFAITGSGGESSHVADLAERAGVELPHPEPGAKAALEDILPEFGNPRNPLDGTGAMYEDHSVFPRSLEVIVDNDTTDLVAVNISQLVRNESHHSPMHRFAQGIIDLPEEQRRGVFAYSSTTAGTIDRGLMEKLAQAKVPMLMGTQNMLSALAHVHRRNQRPPAAALSSMGATIDWPEASGLDAISSWQFLSQAGLPLVDQVAVSTADQAVEAATRLGYPVVMKVASARVAHKSDLGGVALGLDSEAAVRGAFGELTESALPRFEDPDAQLVIQPMAAPGVEMLAGVIRDPVLGAAVVLGAGGVLVELIGDTAVGVPPFTDEEAAELIGQLKVARLLQGVRGASPADMAALRRFIQTLGEIARSLPPWVSSIDLNPILVHTEGISAVDVWIDVETNPPA